MFCRKNDRGLPWVFCGEFGNDPGHRPWVFESSRGFGRARRRSPKAKPEGEARRRSPKAKPQSEAPPKSRPILLSPLKRPTPTNTENSAQRTASRGGTRVITASSLVEPPAIPHRARAKTRQTKRPGHEKRGATRRRSRANRHTHTASMTEDETRTKAGRP